jgi:hypothetical protein
MWFYRNNSISNKEQREMERENLRGFMVSYITDIGANRVTDEYRIEEARRFHQMYKTSIGKFGNMYWDVLYNYLKRINELDERF